MNKAKKIFVSMMFLLSLCMIFCIGTEAATDENPYLYDETPAEAVTVTVTLSSDGMPLVANDGKTILSNLEITVPYFDLEDFGLEKYYRYGTDENGKYDSSKGVVERPTLLHLFVCLLGEYYLEEGETLMGESSKTVYNFLGESAYIVDDQPALSLADQPPRSLFMSNFWGHDCNLNYYVNHDYPWDSEGWGATCDYITLEDGDVVDVAMFTDWNFISAPDRGFAFFSQEKYEIPAGSEFAIDKVYRVIGGTTGGTDFGTNIVEDTFDYYDYYVVDSSGNLKQYIDDATAEQSCVNLGSFETPGTYFVYAVDKDGGVNADGTSDASCAPAVATLIVNNRIALSSVENPDPVVDVENGTALEDIKLPETTMILSNVGVKSQVKIVWNLNHVNYIPSSVASQTFTVKGVVEVPDNMDVNGVSLEVEVSVTVNEAASVSAAGKAIDAIGKVAFSDVCKDKIDAARTAYDALNEEGKKLLSEKATLLTAAESQYAALKTAAEEEAKKAEEEAAKKAAEEAAKKAEEEAAKKAAEEAAKKAEEEAAKKAEEEAAKKAAEIAAAKKAVTETEIRSLKATAYKSTGIKLSWSKNSKVTGYEIYRSTKANKGYSKVKTITKNSTNTYTLKKGLKKSTTYYYRIRGYKVIDGKKVYTPYTRIAVNLNKKKAVQAIRLSGLKAKVTKGKVVLTWNGSHDSMYKLKGFKVYQSTKSKSGYKAVATVSKAKTTIKKGLKKNKTYYFKVCGYVKIGKKMVYTKAVSIKVKAK